jgi:ATP/maltotriose-dependent transcriptional regulator MalT
LLELCQAGPGDVPPALAELICARLDRLSPATRQVLQTAAVLEPDFEAALLRRASGRSEEEVLEALDELGQTAVLVERGPHYAFAHPLAAAVVRQKLSGARRAFLHHRAAEALEAGRPHHLSPIAGRLAYHYTQANELNRAAHYAEMAAQYALSLAAPAEAVDFYRQAIALESTPARQMGLGQALRWQGDLPGARQAFEAALAGLASSNRPGAAMACLELAETYLPAGQPDQTVRWAEQALTYLDHPLETPAAYTTSVPPDPAAHAMAHLLLGAGLLQTGLRLAEAEHHLTTANQLAAAHTLAEVSAQSRFELGNLLARRNDLAGAVAAFQEASRLAEIANNQHLLVLGHNNAAYHSLLAGDLTAAHTHIETALALNESLMLSIPRQYLYSTRGEIALAEQQWAEAENWFKRGWPEVEKHHNQELKATYQANLSLAARGRGDLDNALWLLETAREMAASLTAPTLQIQLDLWLTELYQERGEGACAKTTLSQVLARLAGVEQPRLQAWADRLRV